MLKLMFNLTTKNKDSPYLHGNPYYKFQSSLQTNQMRMVKAEAWKFITALTHQCNALSFLLFDKTVHVENVWQYTVKCLPSDHISSTTNQQKNQLSYLSFLVITTKKAS